MTFRAAEQQREMPNALKCKVNGRWGNNGEGDCLEDKGGKGQGWKLQAEGELRPMTERSQEKGRVKVVRFKSARR